MSDKNPLQYFSNLKKKNSFRLRTKTNENRGRTTNMVLSPVVGPMTGPSERMLRQSKRRSRSMSPVMRELKEKLLIRNRESRAIQENRCKSVEDLLPKISEANRLKAISGKFPDISDFLEQSFTFLELEENITRIGLYRIPGNYAEIEKLWLDVTEKKSLDFTKIDTYNITSLIKLAFRKFEKPILKFEVFEEISQSLESKNKIPIALKRKIPKFNFVLLKRLIMHLRLVGRHKDKNLMDTQNLAIIWSPCLMSGDYCKDPANLPIFYDRVAKVLGYLIENYDTIF